MWFKKSHRGAAAMLPLLLVALVWTGCGESITTPDAPVYTLDNPPPVLVTAGSAGVTATAGAWKGVVGEEGGVVSGGRYSLRFYEGAVDDETVITIQQSDLSALDVVFGPHGIHFKSGVILSIDYSGTNADPSVASFDKSVPAFYYFNEGTGLWEEMRGHNNTTERVFMVKLEHFSRYALGGKPGDGTADW